MTTYEIHTVNEQGQVASFLIDTDNPKDVARAEILRQRIARGELGAAEPGAMSQKVVKTVVDDHTGAVDEKGDLLKSVHGGGLDPDADGDATGTPSGSKAPEETTSGDTGDGPSLSMSRAELDEAAKAAGVEEPEKLANKQAVLDAIEAK